MPKLTTMRSSIASAGAVPARARIRFGLIAVLVLLVACVAASPAYADVGVLLNESLDTSLARITGSGHSAVYFSRICAESPVKLRLCRPDEQGSVMSNYTTLGEDQPFEWNIVPLSVYLYGVEDPQNRPLFGSQKIKHALEERYRTNFLSGYCDSPTCRKSGKAEWREMVGATLERSIYIFVVETSVEQDRALIAEFNSRPNQNHFNGITQNCASFSRRVINTYYPHAARADYLNDFGLITPKAIARSFTRFGERHPEAHLRVLHFAQLPGTIKRSTECRNGTEQLYHSKKLLVPMILFADHELPFMAASYLLTGRFNPEHELEQHPTAEASDIKQEIRDAKAANDVSREEILEAVVNRESEQLVGTAKEWKQYREEFGSLTNDAISREIIPNYDFLGRLFKYLDRTGALSVDPNGSLWLDLSQGGKPSRLGLSASNIFAYGSDSQWAYAVILARADHYLKSPKHSREIMPEFKNDWALLQAARANSTTDTAASNNLPSGSARATAISFTQIQ
ncbi:MAG TPA: hypothetical protein VJW94_13585 [Candidatus Acidoferrum sp.]|nr:hypothetical protein [Candidatus Acidoferrum sp.]